VGKGSHPRRSIYSLKTFLFLRGQTKTRRGGLKITYDDWAVVWSDAEEIDKILSASEGQIRDLLNKIKAGEVTLKLPFIEYSTRQSDSKQPLDFEREATLINSLEPLTTDKFSERWQSRKPFRPFVAMVEGTFILVFNPTEYYKSKWNYLKQSNLVGDESVQKIESYLQLADWEITEKFKAKDNQNDGRSIQTFDIDLMNEAKNRYPNALNLINRNIFEEKPLFKADYNYKKYIIINFNVPQSPSILFPISAREYIPGIARFYGRICGIVNVLVNPPLEGMPNIALQAVILALPIDYRTGKAEWASNQNRYQELFMSFSPYH
jgi:hypothetical protein